MTLATGECFERMLRESRVMFAKLFRSNGPRRVAFVALAGVIVGLPLAASAWQGPDWNASLRWTDGREVQWRATPALGCDGANVELRLVNNSQTSGFATMKDITFTCARGTAPFVVPERSVGQIAPGGAYAVSPIACACAEKGGVKDLMSVGIDIVRQGASAETLANGCTYTGNFVSGQRHGKGLYACPSGYIYEGSYTMGLINGHGSETLPTGERYEGDFVNGVRQGKGRLVLPDGSTYEGAYVAGKREGSGTQTFTDGSVYVGEWKNDHRTGQGVYTYDQQRWTYDGAWVNDKRQGDGRLSRIDGSYSYIGPFVNDQRHGQATTTFGDGRIFRGAFVNDVQKGAGELTFKDGRKITGQFLDHVPNGQAVEFSNQGTLNGVWTNGMLSGMVTVTYADGTHFEGLFANGKRNGKGTDFLKDGSKQECTWVNDVRQPLCTRVTPDGKRIEYRTPTTTKRN